METDRMTLSWEPGDGTDRIAVCRATNAVDWIPEDRVQYEATNDFTLAPPWYDGSKVVYNGPGTNVTVVGLSPDTVYHFKIFEYMGSGGAEAYFTQGDVAAGHRATFAAAYDILAVAGEHGAIEPSGLVTVPFGQSTSFLVTADLYYSIETICTNGAPLSLPPGLSTYTALWSEVCSTGIVSAGFTARLAGHHGTPWWWLAQHKLTNEWTDFDAAELLDGDQDTLPAWAEYVAGTDPTNDQSVLELSSQAGGMPGGHVIYWSSVSSRYYHVYIATNLDQDFERVTNDLPAIVPLNTYTDTVAQEHRSVFYRVRASLQPGE